MARHGDVLKHRGAEGDTKLACCKVMCPNMCVSKSKGCRRPDKACMLQGNVARNRGAEGTKLACHKVMWRGTGVPKTKGMPNAKGCRGRYKACMLQGNVARHVSAECDTKLACCKTM
ncbi:Hypothetical predicted protein [Prunus dulcis]|uniref:Uncharacterized protein n=1 Tax=Prunus dulcis TaxID=3755 RepID=A0A5E4EP00_PRUDU|nr:Hypothetical predicted protein [Prunus dulcis]